MKPIFIYLFIYFIAFILLRHFFPKGILFYQGIYLAMFLSIIFFSTSLYIQNESFITAFKDTALGFLLVYSFTFTVPTTIDRSYSVIMLVKMANAHDGLSKQEIEASYVDSFINAGGIDKRIQEQIATGSITKVGEKYSLTPAGKALVRIFKATAIIFSCRVHE